LTARTIPTLRLNTGDDMPQLGLGVFQVPPDRTAATVGVALSHGYRLIDTAAAYGNEPGVGAALAGSEIPRESVFVTTKLWNEDQGHASALRAFEGSLGRLGLDYVDLYLIHWPAPRRGRFVETWRAFEEIHDRGGARAIGVSNFQVEHLERLLAEADVVPAVNQVELHPRLQQEELRAFHARHGIVTQAWSPLAKGRVLGEQAIAAIATEHGKSTAQVILRWHLQLGNAAIPKSVTPERIEQNADVLDFELNADEMTRIGALDSGARTGPHPDSFGG
jgi:2,5-diketo-D-gluconate reductase A